MRDDPNRYRKRFDAGEVRAFFALLAHELRGLRLRHAIEVAHESFARSEFVDLARRAGVATVWLEDEGSPPIADRTADSAYLRPKRMERHCPIGNPDPRSIGVGGDYDGMQTGPVGMEDVTGYTALFAELARRGYSLADLEKIASRNIMRALKAAEAYAAAHRGDPPIETPVAAAG